MTKSLEPRCLLRSCARKDLIPELLPGRRTKRGTSVWRVGTVI